MTNDESSETESAGCAFAAASAAAYFATVASAMASPTPFRNQQSDVGVRRQRVLSHRRRRGSRQAAAEQAGLEFLWPHEAVEKPWTDEAGEFDT